MSPKLNLYVDIPVPLFKARVNMTSITYPLSSLIYDTVTLGAFADIQFDATLLLGTFEGGDDLGRVRVNKPADATNIFIARTGKGYEDGNLVVQNNAFITVLDDYRVWAKLPYFNTDTGIDYKDGDVEVDEYTDEEIPPVSNCGPGTAGTIDSGTNLLTVQFPRDGIDVSFIIANGASIATYAWDVKDGTITVGTSASAVITATFPAGFRWVALTITDSNGISHTSRCPVLAVDPDADPTFKAFSVKQSFEKKGSTLDLEIYDELNRDEYLDGSLVLFWIDEPSDPGDRDHMRFIGWLDKENHSVRRIRTGLQKSTTMTAVDVCGRLSLLPGFPQALTREEEGDEEEDYYQWSYMPDLDMQKALHYLLLWHSTALSVADFTLPSLLTSYTAMRLDSGANSLFEQVDQQAQKVVPDHYLTCNSQGQMNVRRDWRLDDVADRPAVVDTVAVEEWNDLTYDYSRHPKYHVLRSGAIVASTDWVIVDDEETLPLAFSIAPSDASAFSQGTTEMTQNEGLALDQEGLNICEGHRYALINSRFGNFTWKDPTGEGYLLWEPSLMNRIQLNMSALLATYRGLPFDYAIGMCQSMSVEYTRTKYGTAIKASVTWTKEEEGFPALTYEPEEDETTPVEEVIGFVPPDLDDDVVYGGDITGYIYWDGDNVCRTWDLDDATPTWENITEDLDGLLYDLQYFHVDADTIGAWALTVDQGIWLTMDIMAATVVWDNVLTQATIVAGDDVPTAGTVEPKCMAHYWLTPGHLCVATGPVSNGSGYPHSFYWVTFDYGANWTHVDMNSEIYVSADDSRGYCFSGTNGMAAFRSAPTIYCLRNTDRTGTSNGETKVFVSEDGGLTWGVGIDWITSNGGWSAGQNEGSITHPYPSPTSPAYISRGGTASSTLKMFRTGNEWNTGGEVTPPATHQGGAGHGNVLFRFNKNPFIEDHILAVFRVGSSTTHNVYESTDAGDNWTLLDGIDSAYDTPNGWPPDPDQWVMIHNADPLTYKVRMTLDYFNTYLDKTGNLESVVLGADFDPFNMAGGFALPKVGVNSD